MTMSATDSETIKLSGSSAIHVGPIVTSGSNETISIVIPLSAQVATVAAGRVQAIDDLRPGGACNDCGKDFASGAVKPDNSKGCPFPTCSRYGRAFSRAHDLKRHIARHEAKKERLSETVNVGVHRCSICSRHFFSEAVLKKHAQIHERTNQRQGESQSFVCHLCKKRYGHEKKLNAHLATHDKKSISTVCALCGLRFGGDGELQVHMKEHTTSTLEAQSGLGDIRSLPQLDQVEEEFLEDVASREKVPGKTSMASVWAADVDMEVDVERTRNNNATDKIRCDYCWKTFKSKWTLNSHVAAHEGRFQFDCDQCGKKFVRKSHFEGHIRSHEAARPYTCDICGSTFKQAKHRREHVKRKHPGTQNAVQNLLDSISACGSEESSVDQPKFTILVPVEFNG